MIPEPLLRKLLGKIVSKRKIISSAGSSRFDIKAWIAKYGLVVSKEKPWRDGLLHELEKCPFNPEHEREARITQNGEGAMGFNASTIHASTTLGHCEAYWNQQRKSLRRMMTSLLRPEHSRTWFAC